MSAGVYTSLKFTPTESLIIDVLVARYRLGDTLWTFESRNMPALRRLETKKLVHAISGVTENTVRVSLSDKALREHGTSWFQLSITMDHLPDVEEIEDSWTKACLEQLANLPQHQNATDPRAINTAHVLMIQMIARLHPLHRVHPDEDSGITLQREYEPDKPEKALAISADGCRFTLRNGDSVEITDKLSDALHFTSRWPA